MRTALERYCNGSAINLNRDMKELGSKDANRSMRGYWEYRSQGPMEETRLFGFFARPGAFVATDFQPRGQYVSQADWDAQRASCEGRWVVLTKKRPYMTDPWPVRLRNELSVYLDRADDS